MKNLVNIFAIALCCVSTACAQDISLKLGIAGNSMDELRALNNDFNRNPEKDFKASPMLGLRVSMQRGERFAVGIDLLVNYTRSKLDYVDPAGPSTFEQYLFGSGLAVTPQYLIPVGEKNVVAFEGSLGIRSTELNIYQSTRTGGGTTDQKFEYESINLFVDPGIRYSRAMADSFWMGLRAGYCADLLTGKLYSEKDRDYYLNASDGAANADWSGFRLELFFQYRLEELIKR